MIKIKLNNLDYRYDVYHIFNLFYRFENIQFNNETDENYDYQISIKEEELTIVTEQREEMHYDLEGNGKEIKKIRRILFKYLRNKTGKNLPWGMIMGIKPTKIVVEMMENGLNEEQIISTMKKEYFLQEDKAKLCIDVAKVEKEKINKDPKLISIYIGMPFCPTRCLYCSFASNPIKSCVNMVEPYLEALKYEIDRIKAFVDKKDLNIECVYFGGGTPTAVDDEQFHSTLALVYKSFVEGRNVKEFNVECGRPDSITEAKLIAMKKYNVNRISINPQTMNNDTLEAIGRSHNVEDVIEKFNVARDLGFDNINMDLIIGLPNEDLTHVENTCKGILELNPDSITVHGMALKRASILHEQILLKKVKIIEQNELDEMYKRTVELSKKLGMTPYYMYRQKNMVGNMENVGYSKPSKEGIYNIEIIEEKQTIIALGANAVTKVVFLETNRIERSANLKDLKEYINRIEEKVEEKIKLLEELY